MSKYWDFRMDDRKQKQFIYKMNTLSGGLKNTLTNFGRVALGVVLPLPLALSENA
jgi:hypothetical protein